MQMLTCRRTDTLILQLGYILHTVPTWKKTHALRVIVFVEYESEVEEERGRLNVLLEKLRIEAEVLVFWLASGSISTYETIIHGHNKGAETEALVNDCLRDEDWWDDLRAFRGSSSMTASQELDSLVHHVRPPWNLQPPRWFCWRSG
jgi:solute carrier family 12 (potassium/chloride transporters), member 9